VKILVFNAEYQLSTKMATGNKHTKNCNKLYSSMGDNKLVTMLLSAHSIQYCSRSYGTKVFGNR